MINRKLREFWAAQFKLDKNSTIQVRSDEAAQHRELDVNWEYFRAREVSPALDAAYAECISALKSIATTIPNYPEQSEMEICMTEAAQKALEVWRKASE
jgi:hypothetical protein